MSLDHTTRLNSLGFAKPPSETRVVVAMSGGVDSSVVAAMLAEGIASDRAVNLLQGDYRPRSAIDLPRPALIRFGALAATAVLAACCA